LLCKHAAGGVGEAGDVRGSPGYLRAAAERGRAVVLEAVGGPARVVVPRLPRFVLFEPRAGVEQQQAAHAAGVGSVEVE
jgi:hypothetical protein